MHNRVFQLVQLILNTPPANQRDLRQSLTAIYREVNAIRREMRDYLSYVQPSGMQNRDILLLFNALNHISNQLFYLDQLSSEASNVEKVMILENFFRARSELLIH